MNLACHSSLFFVGMSRDDGSIVCWHSGALYFIVASGCHGPLKEYRKASVVARMLEEMSVDMTSASYARHCVNCCSEKYNKE